MMANNGISRRDFVKGAAALGLAGLIRIPAHAAADAYPIGCYTRPWDKYDYLTALDAIAEAGFEYAGIMTAKGKSWVIITPETPVEEAAKIGEEVKKRGLKALSVYGDFSVAESVEKGVQALRRVIENCAACGSPNLLLGGIGEEKLYQAYYKAIAECCAYAAEKRVGLSVKPHGGLNATGPQCRKAIERVNHKNFGLWYDPGNIFYYSDGKLDPVDDAATVDGLVVGMSVKDFRLPKEVMVTPGTGMVNFAKVLARLQQGGFTGGPLVVECLEAGDRAKVTAEAKKALLFLRELTGQKK
ncbi:MAG: sugar phosphate isomerase/epimerase family protein [bacterium]